MKNTSKLSPDDPKLTAYALGELDPVEHAAVEAAVRADPALQAAVAELRAFTHDLSGALAGEPVESPLPASTPPNSAEPAPESQASCHVIRDMRLGSGPVAPKAEAGPAGGAADPYRRRKVVRFPLYYVVTGLAAAGFAVVVWIHDRNYAEKEAARVQVFEVNLAPGQPASPSTALPAETAPASQPLLETKPAAAQAAASSVAAAPAAVASPVDASVIAGSKFANTPLLEQVKRDTTDHVASPISGGAPLLGIDRKDEPVVFGHERSVPAPAPAGDGRLAKIAAMPLPLESKTAAEAAPVEWRVRDAFRSRQNLMVAGYVADASTLTALADPNVIGQAGGRAAGGAHWSAGEPQIATPPPMPAAGLPSHLQPNTEGYAYVQDNAFLGARENPLSTFSIDVDTASYANVRRFLRMGGLPPRDAVRIEELVNYFPYRYPPPTKAHPAEKAGEPAPDAGVTKDAVAPFAAHLEVASAPWAPEHRLVRIGLKGREVASAERSPANLVFLLDVSGSMSASNKLPLVKESLRLLLGKLRADDRVAIVTYAGASGLALPSTPVKQKDQILASIETLRPGGSTNGAMGIQLAYDVAKANFVAGGLNRVILCTDGDFNVGVTSQGELVRLIEQKAKSGVFLTVLGFGMGNYKDATLEQLADKGNGAYGYIDTEREARKLLVEQVEGTLAAIAKDVKVQVEFNPARVAAYRLIGYENRLLKKEDFNNDTVDAGEIGAGHTVTALYEIVPAGREWTSAGGAIDELKYRPVETPSSAGRTPHSDELLTVKIRYKAPEGDTSRKLEFPLVDRGADFAAATPDFKFAAAVAGFGLVLRESPHKGAASFGKVIDWAEDGLAEDPEGYRAEFIELVRSAQRLANG